MDYIELEARAKINFSIDVTRKREDGYHEVMMIMQSVKLHDIIRIEKGKSGIELTCSSKNIPSDASNIAYKASEYFLSKYLKMTGVKIHIDKRIPVSAGLAGGSTDAAAVLLGLNQLFDINVDKDELCKIGLKVGADVPFCIMGGTMLAQGIGEKLTPLAPVKNVAVLIVKPPIEVSTKWVYQNYKMDYEGERPDTQLLIDAIKKEDRYTFASSMRNVLESVTAKEYPIVNQIKAKLLNEGAIGSIMSGSGSSVFGIFENMDSAKKVADTFKNSDLECFLTETYCD